MNKLKHLIRVENQAIAKELLLAAKNRLSPDNEFVCVNLKEVAETSREKIVAEIIRGEIRMRLGNFHTVCGWLNEKVGVSRKTLDANGGKRLVAYRQRWIDSMIAELR